MILLFIFLILIIIFYSYQAKWNPIHPNFILSEKILKIGHRGAPVLALENTLDSFTKAFETGIDGIELDVQFSKDKKLVVFHDWTLASITKCTTSIEEMTYSEILALSHVKNFPIPLLSDVLEICPKDKIINDRLKNGY